MKKENEANQAAKAPGLNIDGVSGSKAHRIAQIQKHLENGDIKFTRTPLFEPPKLIIGCDLAAEGTSDYSITYYR